MTSAPANCETVAELLPEYAEGGLHPAGPVEVHLASCVRCQTELGRYRDLLGFLNDLCEIEVEVPEGYLEDVLRTARVGVLRARIPSIQDVREVPVRVVSAIRTHGAGVRYALATIGGAAAGATALAIVWWSIGRRAVTGTAA
jgi:hypothetical protein